MATVMTDQSRLLIEVRLEIDVATHGVDDKNHYDLLGVGRHCERTEIEGRSMDWIRKIQRWMRVPGLSDDYRARVEVLHTHIEEAHRTLIDTVGRIHYDQRLKAAEAAGHTGRVLPRTERAQEAADGPAWSAHAPPSASTSNRPPPHSPSNRPPPHSPSNRPPAGGQTPSVPPRRSTASWEAVPSHDANVVIPPPLRRPSDTALAQAPRTTALPPAMPPIDGRVAALESQLHSAHAQIAALYDGLALVAQSLELILGPSESPERRREHLAQAAQIAQRLGASFPPR